MFIWVTIVANGLFNGVCLWFVGTVRCSSILLSSAQQGAVLPIYTALSDAPLCFALLINNSAQWCQYIVCYQILLSLYIYIYIYCAHLINNWAQCWQYLRILKAIHILKFSPQMNAYHLAVQINITMLLYINHSCFLTKRYILILIYILVFFLHISFFDHDNRVMPPSPFSIFQERKF